MILDNLQQYVENYYGPKLAFVVTGGAMEIFRLPQTPGASRILTAIYVPYDVKQSVEFISKKVSPEAGGVYNARAVRAASADVLCKAGLVTWPNCKVVAVTAATTTSRYRRGENQAFISVGQNSKSREWIDGSEQEQIIPNITTHHLALPKLGEEEHRLCKDIASVCMMEDRQITEMALNLAFETFTRVLETSKSVRL